MGKSVYGKEGLPDQGDRIPRSRQGAVAVPGSSLSLSCDGLPAVCPAGAAEEQEPAKTSKTCSGRKRSGAEKRGKPTGSDLEVVWEGGGPDVITVPSDGEDGGKLPFKGKEKEKVVWNWDDIGDREEMYLANKYEELYELVMKETTFKCKVGEKGTGKLRELFKSLLVYSRQNIEELQLLEQIQEVDEEDEDDMEIRSDYRRFISCVSFQHRRTCWMVEELFGRYRKVRGELKRSELRAKGLTEENGQLRERLEALTRERNELLGKLDSRRGNGKDASTSMEAEVLDIEMAEEHVPSIPQGIPQSLVGTLEEMIEKKMGELFSRLGQNGPECGAKPMAKNNNKLWSEVVAKSPGKSTTQRDSVPMRGDKGKKGSQASAVITAGEDPKPISRNREKKRKKREWPKLPQTAAVVLTAPVGKEGSCTELLRRARQLVSIEELEIPHLEIRRARSGGYILGVPGPSPEGKADRLATSLTHIAGDTGVRITRPTKRADIRVSGLDESTTPEEVVSAISELTGCPADSIRGRTIRRPASGMGSMWLQGPVEMAIKAANMGRVKVGWASASVEMLKARPLRCYRCLEIGHIGAQCTSETVRALRCFRCGSVGHRAGNCRAEVPRCPLCMDIGRPHKHVLGGPGCDIPSSSRNRGVNSTNQVERVASESVR